ncbi:unnamed protein product [Ectocarpus sp. 13 AM-2016]
MCQTPFRIKKSRPHEHPCSVSLPVPSSYPKTREVLKFACRAPPSILFQYSGWLLLPKQEILTPSSFPRFLAAFPPPLNPTNDAIARLNMNRLRRNCTGPAEDKDGYKNIDT